MKDYRKFIENNLDDYQALSKALGGSLKFDGLIISPVKIKELWPECPKDILIHFNKIGARYHNSFEVINKLFNFMQENYPERMI